MYLLAEKITRSAELSIKKYNIGVWFQVKEMHPEYWVRAYSKIKCGLSLKERTNNSVNVVPRIYKFKTNYLLGRVLEVQFKKG